MRGWWWLAIGFAVPTQAGASDLPYYGPMKHWHGIGYEQGHKYTAERDGSWRITGAIARSGGHAIDIAMYRAAELAREQGFAYVQMLGGDGQRGPGYEVATVYARPSHSPAAPAACKSRRAGTCYTAEVAELIHILGGPDGNAPGTAIVDHLDRYGRAVSYSGFGIAAASLTPRLAAGAAPRVALTDRVPIDPVPASRTRDPGEPATAPVRSGASYEQRLKAQQGAHGRDPQQGWTIGD